MSLFSDDLPGAIWVLSIASLVLGLPGWCLATGAWTLARQERRPSTSAVQ